MIQVDETNTSYIHFLFPKAPVSGRIVAEINYVVKKYEQKLAHDNISLTIEKGNFTASVGRNREVKVTLAKIIVGAISFVGEEQIGS